MNFRQKYTTRLSDEMLYRISTHQSVFTKLVSDLGKGSSKYEENNLSGLLNNSTFGNHKDIPLGYYDEIENGIVMVKHGISGELIRKDDAYLTLDGKFLPTRSPHILSSSSSTFKVLMMKAYLRDDKDALEKLKGKYIKYSSYIFPFNQEDWSPVIAASNLIRFMTDRWSSFTQNNGLQFSPQSAVGLSGVVDSFLRDVQRQTLASDWFKDHLSFEAIDWTEASSVSTYVRMPSDSPIVPNITLLSDRLVDNITLANNRDGRGRPTFILNPAEGMGSWTYTPETIRGTLHHTTINGINFSVLLAIPYVRTENVPTNNNQGVLMQYSAKVTDYKISFRQTEEEKRVSKYYNDLIKPEMDAYTERVERRRAELRVAGHDRRIIESEISNISRPKVPESSLPIFLGVEIELQVKALHQSTGGMANVIKEISSSPFGDHAILKSDSSIGNYGMEIVTIPATLDIHRQVFEEFFFSTKYPHHTKFKYAESCGIHVHISKNCFSPLSLGKFMAFINSPKNSSFMNLMAGRKPNDYCQKQPLKGTKLGVDHSAAIGALGCVKDNKGKVKGLSFRDLGHHNSTRRVAVNLDNANTVEVRIFKSSNDRTNVLRKIEFCDALLRFVREVGTQDLTVPHFVDFILDKGNRKRYPCILRWLASKNFVEHEMKKVEGKNKLVHVYTKNKLKKETK